MIRKLFIVAGAGLVLTVVCLGGAAALASKDLAANGWTWDMIEEGHHHRTLKHTTTTKFEAPITRTLAWSGGDVLDIDVPAEVVFTQGAVASVTVTGPKSLAERVRLEKGRLYLIDGPEHKKIIKFKLGPNGLGAHVNTEDFKIIITAPNVSHFDISGVGDLEIQNYDQPTLDLSISGAGEVDVAGQAKTLNLSISGMGDANLENLKVIDAVVSVSGAGNATVAPTGKADIAVSGTGDVDLTTQPISVATHISGMGNVNQP